MREEYADWKGIERRRRKRLFQCVRVAQKSFHV